MVSRTANIVHRPSFLEQRITNNGYRTTDIGQRISDIVHRSSFLEHRTSNNEHRTTNLEKNQRITFKILSKRIPLEPLIKIDWFSKGFFLRYSSKS
jgi:hypothetical protein